MRLRSVCVGMRVREAFIQRVIRLAHDDVEALHQREDASEARRNANEVMRESREHEPAGWQKQTRYQATERSYGFRSNDRIPRALSSYRSAG